MLSHSRSTIVSRPTVTVPSMESTFPALLTSASHTPSRPHLIHHHRHSLRVIANNMDAAELEPWDWAHKANDSSYSKLKIGIIGFGNYGQFLAKILTCQGHTLLTHSRSDHSRLAVELHVSFFRDLHEFYEADPKVILLCTSILSTESVHYALLPPLRRLERPMFVDVLSIKEFPRYLLLKMLPSEFDVLCTHPMFGPESGKNGWKGLPFVYDKVRIRNSKRCETFLDVFQREGCRMVEMDYGEHDKNVACTHFVTHLVGRVLERLDLESTPMNTKSYERLLDLVERTSKDSFELFYGLFLYNQNATNELERLDLAFKVVERQLCGRLHKVMWEKFIQGPEFEENE